MHQAHALAAAARRGFQHDGISNARRDFVRLLDGFQPARRPRHKGNAGPLHGLPRLGLRAHRVHRRGCRTDELHAGIGTGPGKFRILGKKSVAGMDGVRSGSRGHVKNFLDIEVGLRSGGCPDGISLIGFANVQ